MKTVDDKALIREAIEYGFTEVKHNVLEGCYEVTLLHDGVTVRIPYSVCKEYGLEDPYELAELGISPATHF